MHLNEFYKQVQKEICIKNFSFEERTLALHESATKLWQANLPTQKEKMHSRLANALISVFCLMDTAGIEDAEKCLEQRLVELNKIKDSQTT